IRLCVGCLKGCFDSIMNPNIPTITCMRNPMVGKEGQPITKTTSPKTVLIAGGGMGGMMTANMLKVRGHNPILCEASNKLGGQFNLAGAAPYKGEMLDAVNWEAKESTRLCVDVRLNTVVTPELISQINPDEVIIATGAVASKPEIKGIESKNVFTYEEVLSGSAELSGNVVILGGKMVGLETAQYLTNKGVKCTIIDEAERLGGDLGWIRSMNMLENMYVIGVNQVTNAKVMEIKENEVVYVKDETETSVNCDAVVVALGATSVALEDVQSKCRDLEIPFHVIGDAKSPRVALNTTLEGIEIALNLDSENALNI
ncbi:MAG: FAD-dependent oxidoreductase, partial [Paraclostridium sp.]